MVGLSSQEELYVQGLLVNTKCMFGALVNARCMVGPLVNERCMVGASSHGEVYF